MLPSLRAKTNIRFFIRGGEGCTGVPVMSSEIRERSDQAIATQNGAREIARRALAYVDCLTF